MKSAPFYEGQKVVYINDVWFKKGSIHTVYKNYRMGCGCWYIDVGEKDDCEYERIVCICGWSEDYNNERIEWYSAKSFVPLEEEKEEICEEELEEMEA